jgi:hypothetical protein
MIVVENVYEYGDIVYLKSDIEQKPRIVVGFQTYPPGGIIYLVRSGTYESGHYDLELTKDKPIF